MKSQHTLQQSGACFAVTVPRDIGGYEVITRVIETAAGSIVGGLQKKGDVVTEIAGRSGTIELVRYETGTNRPPIWPKLKRLVHPNDIASFMSKWGAVDRSSWMQPNHVSAAD
jgi:hypothetical protein